MNKIQIGINLRYLLYWIVLALFSCEQTSQEPYQPIILHALNSMQRVQPNLPVHGKESVQIMAAKNEFEAFQIVIEAGVQTHLENIHLEVSDLEGPSGLIGKNHITVYREEEVFLQHSSPRAEEPPGSYPDALVPFINPVTGDSILPGRKVKALMGDPLRTPIYTAYPIDLYSGQRTSIWVDVYVPATVAAGVYKGSLTAVTETGISKSVDISLKVWDFQLPDYASHRTHLGHFSLIGKMWNIDHDSEHFRKTELAFCEELAMHRVNPPIPHSLLPKVNPDGSITIDPEVDQQLIEYVQRVNLVDFEIPRTPFMTNTSNSDRPTPQNQTDPEAVEKSKRYYKEMYQYIVDRGWEDRAYLYMLDEPNSVKDYQQVINLAKAVEQGAPDLKKLVVEQTYKHQPDWPDLDPYIDIWCTLFGFIDRETIEQKLSNGDEVWSYTALVQPATSYHPQYEQVKDYNPPYWHIDQPLLSYRIPTWINRQYGITGLLYWTTSGWYDDSGPWKYPTMGPWPSNLSDSAAYNNRYFNGGGLLFYPGIQAGFDGPVASIRLKNIREGLEDYEYFKILDDAGEQEFVKSMLNQVCRDWWDFTRDPEKILQVRRQMAEKIQSLQ